MPTSQLTKRPKPATVDSASFVGLTPERLAVILRQRITTGQFKTGDRFPSVRQIAEHYRVSPTIAHQGLRMLADSRWLEMRPRSAAVVASAEVQAGKNLQRENTVHVIVGRLPLSNTPLIGPGICDGLLHAWGDELAMQLNVVPEKEDILAFVERIVGPPRARPEIVGAILNRCPRSVHQWFVKRELPAVVVGHVDEDIQLPYVDRDQYNMGRVVAAHLLERGHQRIGFMNGHWLPGDNLLLSGMQRSLAERNVPADHLAVHVVPPEEGMIRAGFETLRRSRDITGLVCRSDQMTLECLDAAKQSGLRVPEDLALVCAGENGIALRESKPSITSMSRDGEELGRLAGDLLAKLVSGQPVQRVHVEVPCELIQRESS